MKKIFFSALLATVAVGGAFASKTLVSPYAQIGSACKEATIIETGCTTTNDGTQCTAEANDNTGTGLAFNIKGTSSPFACSAPLKLPN